MSFSIVSTDCGFITIVSGSPVYKRRAARFWCRFLHVAVFIICVSLVALNPATAANNRADDSSNEELLENLFITPRREILMQLNNAKQLIHQGRYSEAVRALGWILDRPEDYFIRTEDSADAFHSIKSDALAMIGSLPRQGRELYELQYGAKAKRLLQEAVLAQDTTAVAKVSSRYFHTVAGGEATLLLGLSYLDHGRPLAAAEILSRLDAMWDGGALYEPTRSMALAVCWARAGFIDKARERLELLRVRYPAGRVNIGGEEVAVFDADEDPLEWLQSHTGPLYENVDEKIPGDAADGMPLLSMLWNALPSDHPDADELMQRQLQFCRQHNISLLTAGRPLVVDDTVFMRSLNTLIAVDFHSGKRLWMVPFDDPLDEDSQKRVHRQVGQLIGAMCHRYWRDDIYNSLSSDSRFVYSIGNLRLHPLFQGSRFIFRGARRIENPNWPLDYNTLLAHDVITGKLAWRIGGPDDDSVNNMNENHRNAEPCKTAGSFFLGAPLCLRGKLYVLAERQGEIVLHVLDALSGDVLGTQPLAIVENDIQRDWPRRYTAVSPVNADGVIICPTGNGAVVAVDEATHALLWGQILPCDIDTGRRNKLHMRQAAIAARMPGSRHSRETTWLDCEPVIVDDKVVLTAPGCDYLYCLGLYDGAVQWKSLCRGDLFIACADRSQVVLAGPHGARALKITDGKPLWDRRRALLDLNASTSGRGFLAGGYYYLPAGSAGVVAIDVQSGRITRVAKSRENNVPGNLVRHEGRVLSQGLDGLKSYYELGSLCRRVDAALAQKPDDAVALALHGEALIDEGKLAEAVSALRRSYSLRQNPRTEWLLRRSWLQALEENFQQYRADAPEIEKLCTSDAQMLRYWRIMGEGLEQQGEWDAALDCYLRLADLPRGDLLTVRLSDAHRVCLDRWLRVRIASLRKAASSTVRERLEAAVKSRLDAAIASSNLDYLRRLLDQFAYFAAAIDGRDRFVDMLVADGQYLEAEMLLRQEARSKNAMVGGRATLRLAELLQSVERWEDAATCYRQLAFEFGDVACSGKLTGRQIVDRLPKADQVRHWFQPDTSWPTGAVEVTQTSQPRIPNNLIDLNFHGSRRPFFDARSLKIDKSKQIVVGVGAYGDRRWEHPLTANVRPKTYLPVNQKAKQVSARGHMLVLMAGNQYVALDCFDPNKPRALWRIHPDQMLSASHDVGQAGINAFWAEVLPPTSVTRLYRQPWQTGLLTDQYMCYGNARGVVAVAPISKRPLWSNEDVPDNFTLFGDENLLFVGSDQSNKAIVLRGADGTKLKTVDLPSGQRLTTIGRKILVCRRANGKQILEMVDPWRDRVLWGPYEFNAQAKCDVVGGEALGVMEPDGHFTLFTLPQGKKLVDARLEPEPNLHEIVLLESDGSYFLVTNSLSRPSSGHTPQPIRGLSSQLIRQGRVYGFAPDGRQLWPNCPRGVEVSEQQLLMCQPSRLPVLTFACTAFEPKKRPLKWLTSVLMIDKRTGRVVLDQQFDQQTQMLELLGDPAGNTVDLRMQNKNIRLVFTDDPPLPVKESPLENMKSTSVGQRDVKASGNATRRGVQLSLPPVSLHVPDHAANQNK